MTAAGAGREGREHYRSASRQTPFHRHAAARNETQAWRRVGGFLAAERYTDPELEHAALRNAVTVADASALVKYDVAGPDALRFLERLLTGRIASLAPGRSRYVLMCDEDGALLGDALLLHDAAGGRYRLCCRHRHLDWLSATAGGLEVELRDVTAAVATLAVQGPMSATALRRAGLEGVQALAPGELGRFHAAAVATPVTVSRTGFTGDLGYELWLPWDGAADWWPRLFAVPDLQVVPLGWQALELARLEAGFIMAGHEYLPADRVVSRDAARTPLELGLERLVDFRRPVFNGRAALAAQARAGLRRRLVPVFVEGSTPATGGLVLDQRRRRVGVITSAAWSPAIKQNIAFALLDAPWGRGSDALWVEIDVAGGELERSRQRVRCRPRPRLGPFFDPVRRRVTPPGRV